MSYIAGRTLRWFSHLYKVLFMRQPRLNIIILSAAVFFAATATTRADREFLQTKPKNPAQGNAIMVSLPAVSGIAKIKSASFAGKKIDFFYFRGLPTAFVPIDLKMRPGNYRLQVSLFSGQEFTKNVSVESRENKKIALGIPKKLGGNNAESVSNLLADIERENATLSGSYKKSGKVFWKNNFVPPLEKLTVTDDFGTTRETGRSEISHKGTDFEAKMGEPVLSINRGVVRLAKNLRVYGKTIDIDHGLGLYSLYLHLSKIIVSEGELVLPGKIIGYAGATGYAEAPHLHFGIRIQNVPVDPMQFFELVK